MSIVNKHRALRQLGIVAVICDRCGHTTEADCTEDQICDALIQRGRHRGFVVELDLLERTERLFACFPESRHRIIAEHLHFMPNNLPTLADEDFERALAADKELSDFLTRCKFLLPARLKFVREQVESYLWVDQLPDLCPACYEGTLCLEQELYNRLF